MALPALRITGVATHPEDDQILAAALDAEVDYLVTGDKKLLAIGTFQGIDLITPRAFLSILEMDDPDRV